MFKKFLSLLLFSATVAAAQTHQIPTLDKAWTWQGTQTFQNELVLVPLAGEPTCTSAIRGLHWNVPAGDSHIQNSATTDQLQVCTLSTGSTYAWIPVGTGTGGGGGGSASGSAGAIQFRGNTSGSFSSDTALSFDSVAKRLSATQLYASAGIESPGEGIFSDLSTNHDGGVLNPTTGDAGAALQQTLIDAGLWSQTNGGKTAKVMASPFVNVSAAEKIYIPANVDLVCAAYSPKTWTGGCIITNTSPPVSTLSGGHPLVLSDFTFGVLSDNKTVCFQGTMGCNVLGGGNSSFRGFTLNGTGQGGADIGLRVAAAGFNAEDIAAGSSFGGPFVLHVAGFNDAYQWIYATNVNEFFCSNPLSITAANMNTAFGMTNHDADLGAIDINMVDGRVENNQTSTGCAFSHGFASGPEYPHLAAAKVDGGGDLVDNNLFQVDSIALIVDGQEHRIVNNRVEYQSRELIRDNSVGSIISNNYGLSGCLDRNLANIWHGQAVPTYPASTSLYLYYVIEDSNGNAEIMYFGNQGGGSGTTSASAPTWNTTVGGYTYETHVQWLNAGPYNTTANPETNPVCNGMFSTSQGVIFTGNRVGQEVAVDGPSYYHSSFSILTPGTVGNNEPDTDVLDSYGNGAAWTGGDQFGEGGPFNLPTNGLLHGVTTNGSGGAWVGDYLITQLTDSTPQGYSYFLGMSSAPFYVVSTQAASTIYPQNVGVYGHPELTTCDGYPFTMSIGKLYGFVYDYTSSTIRPLDCTNPNTTYVAVNFVGKTSPGNQKQGTVHAFGNIVTAALPNIANPTVNGQAGSATYTYTYRVEVFQGGADFTSTSDTTVTSGYTLSSHNLAITAAPDSSWTELKVYRVATGDGSGTGLIADVMNTGGTTPSATDSGQAIISSSIPANSINTSGRFRLANAITPPTSGTAPGNAGDWARGTDGCLYWWTADNTVVGLCGTTP